MSNAGNRFGLQDKQHFHGARVRNGNQIDVNAQSNIPFCNFLPSYFLVVVIPTSDFALFTSYVSGYSAVRTEIEYAIPYFKSPILPKCLAFIKLPD